MTLFRGSGEVGSGEQIDYLRSKNNLSDVDNVPEARSNLGLESLSSISGLTPADSTFIVGDGVNWVAESGAIVRTSIGLNNVPNIDATDASNVELTDSENHYPNDNVESALEELGQSKVEIVDSVSDLQSGSFESGLNRIWLSGYYGLGTSGGGPLYRDSSDTTTADNGGTVFVDSDGVRWKRPVNNNLSVTEFGAVGDGSTDDTDSIQNAIDTAVEGSTICFPVPSVHYLVSSIQLKGRVALQGPDDRFNDCIVGDGTGPVLTTGSYPGGNTSLNRDIFLRGLTVRGVDYPAVEWLTAFNFSWDNCYFSSNIQPAVNMRFSNKGEIRFCRINGSGAGFACDLYDNCNGIVFLGGQISGGAAGSGLSVDLSTGVYVVGTVFESCSDYSIRVSGHPTNTGNCNAIYIAAYIEASDKPISLGETATVLGGSLAGTYIGNDSTASTYAALLGSCVGVSLSGLSARGQPSSPPTLIKVISVSGLTALFPTGCDISAISHINYGTLLDLTGLSTSSWTTDVRAKNRIEFLTNDSDVTDLDSHSRYGETRQYVSDTIICSAGFTARTVEPSVNGYFLESVEIIDQTGSLDGNLHIGNNTSIVDNVNQDISALGYTDGYSDVTPSKYRGRDGEPLRIEHTGGSTSGTFRVRVTWRR